MQCHVITGTRTHCVFEQKNWVITKERFRTKEERITIICPILVICITFSPLFPNNDCQWSHISIGRLNAAAQELSVVRPVAKYLHRCVCNAEARSRAATKQRWPAKKGWKQRTKVYCKHARTMRMNLILFANDTHQIVHIDNCPSSFRWQFTCRCKKDEQWVQRQQGLYALSIVCVHHPVTH